MLFRGWVGGLGFREWGSFVCVWEENFKLVEWVRGFRKDRD